MSLKQCKVGALATGRVLILRGSYWVSECIGPNITTRKDHCPGRQLSSSNTLNDLDFLLYRQADDRMAICGVLQPQALIPGL